MRQERSGGGRIQGDIHDFPTRCTLGQSANADQADLLLDDPLVLDLARAPPKRADKGCPLRFPRLPLLLRVRDTVLFCTKGEDHCNPKDRPFDLGVEGF